mmetsp:Transcript_90734/g.180428  ORF Transcript_90734/g.180428 Transcript_90734/m.180428 type:complete len:470 (-) Transcript_90734:147-1556(-)
MSVSAGSPRAMPPAAAPPTAAPAAARQTHHADPHNFSSEPAKPNLDPAPNRKLVDRRSLVDAKGVQWRNETQGSTATAETEEADRDADGEPIQAQECGTFQAQVSGASNISALSRTTNNTGSVESLSRQASAIDKLVSTISSFAVDKAMREAVRECKFCVSIANPKGIDYPLIAVSEEFEAMTGYRRNEILGVNCRFLNQGCDLDPGQLMGLRMASETGAPFTALLPNRKKSGELFLNLLDLRGLTIARNLKTGDDVWFLIGIQADMSELANDEDELEEHMEEVKVLADQIRVKIKKELQQMALLGYTASIESLESLDELTMNNQKAESGEKPSTWELLSEPVWRPGSQLDQKRPLDWTESEIENYGTSAVMDRPASTAQSAASRIPKAVEDVPRGRPAAGTKGVTQGADERPSPGSSAGETPVPPHGQTGPVVASASTGRDTLLLAVGVSAVGLALTMFGRWVARRRV